jgi:hypothetical protein
MTAAARCRDQKRGASRRRMGAGKGKKGKVGKVLEVGAFIFTIHRTDAARTRTASTTACTALAAFIVLLVPCNHRRCRCLRPSPLSFSTPMHHPLFFLLLTACLHLFVFALRLDIRGHVTSPQLRKRDHISSLDNAQNLIYYTNITLGGQQLSVSVDTGRHVFLSPVTHFLRISKFFSTSH